jgi:hypothetical protein
LQSAIASLHGDAGSPDSKATLQKMLADDRARGMVLEFMGNWLDFRRFDNHNGVDREQFPTFSDTLRQSMADEPVEYFLDLLRRNGSILELLQSDHMIMNGPLSQHYGIGAIPHEATNRWERVEEARARWIIVDGSFLDAEFAGATNESGKAWILGGS